MQSIYRKIARGHATIHTSEIFGIQTVYRSGRGSLVHQNGALFTQKLNMPEGFTRPRGKPSATGNRRMKPATIQP